MPHGIQVFNPANNKVTMDTNFFLGRIVGQVSTPYVNGSVSADLSTGTPFALYVIVYDSSYNPSQTSPGGGMLNPTLTATSTGVSWVFPPNSSGAQMFSSCLIFYGVY